MNAVRDTTCTASCSKSATIVASIMIIIMCDVANSIFILYKLYANIQYLALITIIIILIIMYYYIILIMYRYISTLTGATLTVGQSWPTFVFFSAFGEFWKFWFELPGLLLPSTLLQLLFEKNIFHTYSFWDHGWVTFDTLIGIDWRFWEIQASGYLGKIIKTS